jgi:hypothetical protein
LARTSPEIIFDGKTTYNVNSETTEMECQHDHYNYMENQWFGAVMFLGDCWQPLPPKEKTTYGNDKARPNATKQQKTLLLTRKGPVPYLSRIAGEVPPCGVVRSDSNDCFLDRHIVNTEHNKCYG